MPLTLTIIGLEEILTHDVILLAKNHFMGDSLNIMFDSECLPEAATDNIPYGLVLESIYVVMEESAYPYNKCRETSPS